MPHYIVKWLRKLNWNNIKQLYGFAQGHNIRELGRHAHRGHHGHFHRLIHRYYSGK